MRRATAIAALLVITAVPGPGSLRGAVVYRQGEGWSTEQPGDEESTKVESTASAQMRKAAGFEAAGETGRAINAYNALVRRFPDSLVAPEAQIKAAQLLESQGDAEAAFAAYGKYVAKYKQGTDFDRAVEGQFRIAKLFLEGERRKVFGMKTFPSMQRAEAMFEEVVKNAPFSRFAPQAQFYVGLAREKQGKTEEALVAYQAVLSRYPTDPVAADARYQIGYLYFRQRQAGVQDPAIANKASEALEEFVARHPDSEKVPQAREHLAALSGGQTRGLLDVAKFYDKTKNYKAAVIYYNHVIKQTPQSDDATFAKQRIEELRQLVGEDALRAGPEKVETGARARARRKAQAQIDTASRPDYVGPPVTMPEETPPPKPRLRTSDSLPGPLPAPVEPTLPVE